jgi:hypothetical protein
MNCPSLAARPMLSQAQLNPCASHVCWMSPFSLLPAYRAGTSVLPLSLPLGLQLSDGGPIAEDR